MDLLLKIKFDISLTKKIILVPIFSLFARKIKDILTFFKTSYSNRSLAFDTGVSSPEDGTQVSKARELFE